MELDCNGPFGLSRDALHMCAHVKVFVAVVVVVIYAPTGHKTNGKCPE